MAMETQIKIEEQGLESSPEAPGLNGDAAAAGQIDFASLPPGISGCIPCIINGPTREITGWSLQDLGDEKYDLMLHSAGGKFPSTQLTDTDRFVNQDDIVTLGKFMAAHTFLIRCKDTPGVFQIWDKRILGQAVDFRDATPAELEEAGFVSPDIAACAMPPAQFAKLAHDTSKRPYLAIKATFNNTTLHNIRDKRVDFTLVPSATIGIKRPYEAIEDDLPASTSTAAAAAATAASPMDTTPSIVAAATADPPLQRSMSLNNPVEPPFLGPVTAPRATAPASLPDGMTGVKAAGLSAGLPAGVSGGLPAGGLSGGLAVGMSVGLPPQSMFASSAQLPLGVAGPTLASLGLDAMLATPMSIAMEAALAPALQSAALQNAALQNAALQNAGISQLQFTQSNTAIQLAAANANAAFSAPSQPGPLLSKEQLNLMISSSLGAACNCLKMCAQMASQYNKTLVNSQEVQGCMLAVADMLRGLKQAAGSDTEKRAVLTEHSSQLILEAHHLKRCAEGLQKYSNGNVV